MKTNLITTGALEALYLFKALRSAFPPACRFSPSCTQYAEDALRIHGVFRAAPIVAARVLSCHPFHPGGWDPVPPSPSARSHG